MPVPHAIPATNILHQRCSVSEYEELIEQGILTEQDRVELIDGKIVPKMAIGGPHSACVNRVVDLFTQTLRRRAVLSVQNPVRLSDSIPEPDIALLKPRDDFYADLAGPGDVLLLIEVADSSLVFDRTAKLPVYARSGIAEFWIANIPDRCVEVYRHPQPDGSYADIQILQEGQAITVLALPDIEVAVSVILG